jgi:parvulin-like peptidyl-prolyl isomerase
MPRRNLLLLVLLAAFVVTVAACGGNGDEEAADTTPGATSGATSTDGESTGEVLPPSTAEVPADAVAIVGETPIPKAEFDRVLKQAQAAYEAQGQTFPAAGTPEYETIKTQAIDFLIQRAELEFEAEALGITVTEEEVQAELIGLKEQFFQGDQQKYLEEIEKQGLTEENVLVDLRAQLISRAIFDEVTKGETVSDADVQAYYDANAAQYTTPESREVAHILVEEKAKAEEIYQQLQDGADFAELAKKFSTDPGSKDSGGKLTDTRGQFVPEFEEVAFTIDTGEIAPPVKSQFGWHVITALEDTVPEAVQTLDEVKDTISEQLLTESRNTVMTNWLAEVKSKYANQVVYATGFAPSTTEEVPTLPTDTAATDTGSTETGSTGTGSTDTGG